MKRKYNRRDAHDGRDGLLLSQTMVSGRLHELIIEQGTVISRLVVSKLGFAEHVHAET